MINKKFPQKISILSLAMSIFIIAQTFASESWETDFEAAKAKATKSGKVMLLDFTGSDWCGWCIKLKKEVFSQKAFNDYAKDNLVLAKIDFPRSKKQSAKVKTQNEALAKKYGIQGFPTILLLSENGKVIGKTGYQAGGAKAYVKHLKKLIKEGS